MMCFHCGEKLPIEEMQKNHIAVPELCPYCGRSRMTYGTNIKLIFRQIVYENGDRILNDPESFRSLALEHIPNTNKDKTIMLMAIQSNVGEYFYKMLYNVDECRKLVKLAEKYLNKEIGFRSARTFEILKVFLFAAGLSKEEVREKSPYSNIYKDMDNLYQNSALSCIKTNPKLAKKILMTSAKAGNLSSCDMLLKFASERELKITRSDWYEINKIITDTPSDGPANFNAIYITTMNYFYDFLHLRSDDDFFDYDSYDNEVYQEYWKKLCIFPNKESYLEHTVRGMLKQIEPNFIFSDINYLEKLAPHDKLIKIIINIYRNDKIREDEKEGLIAYCMGVFYQKKAKKYPNSIIDYNRMATYWHYKSLSFFSCSLYYATCEYMELVVDSVVALFYSGNEYLRSYAVEAVEYENVEYCDYMVIEQEIENGLGGLLYTHLPDYTYLETRLLTGKYYFMGGQVEADINKTIRIYEDILKEYQDDWVILFTVPYLTQCYYEKLLLENSSLCLDKLQRLAQYKKSKMAAKYLFLYYSDPGNIYMDFEEANRYRKIYNSNWNITSDKAESLLTIILKKAIPQEIDFDGSDVMEHLIFFEYCEEFGKQGIELLAANEINIIDTIDRASFVFCCGADYAEKNKLRHEIYKKYLFDIASRFSMKIKKYMYNYDEDDDEDDEEDEWD